MYLLVLRVLAIEWTNKYMFLFLLKELNNQLGLVLLCSTQKSQKRKCPTWKSATEFQLKSCEGKVYKTQLSCVGNPHQASIA